MQDYLVEKIVSEEGSIHLDALPFPPGEVVEVIVRVRATAAEDINPRSLKGTVLRYDRPLEPVAQDDWSALQ